MSMEISTDSTYVVSPDNTSTAGAPVQQLYIDPIPRVTITGGSLTVDSK